MIATGTDIKPLEVVMFMRSVKSRNFFEQMKGRGVRIIRDNDFQAVTQDAKSKTHFVIVDCVGVCESELNDTYPLERKRSISFGKLLQAVAFGNTDTSTLLSLASRLARLEQRLGAEDREALKQAAGGRSLKEITSVLVESLNPDRHLEGARHEFGLTPDNEPTPEQLAQVAGKMRQEAVAPLVTNAALRDKILNIQTHSEQTIDVISQDEVIHATFSDEAKERAQTLVASFEQFIDEHKDEITALQILYSRPHAERLRFEDVKELAAQISMPPRSWTPEALWRAYETLDSSRVHGASATRLLTDIVSLVRYALDREDDLVPFVDDVNERFRNWLMQVETRGRKFTNEQRAWLELIRDHIAASLSIELDDLEYTPFAQRGGTSRAYQTFSDELLPLLNELNEVLAA